MQTPFDHAHTFVAGWEGGLTDHPADPGDITNHGVSLRFLRDYAQSKANRDWLERIGVFPPVTADTIRSLNAVHAGLLFKRAFWDALNLNALPPLTAIATYDAAVNTGTGQAVKFLQRACNALPGEQLVVDGGLGPITRARANEIAPDSLLAGLCINERDGFYKALADSKPSLGVFLKGWLNRTADLRKRIQSLGAVYGR